MALLSMCFPILPGKLDKWQEMIDSWADPSNKAETDKIREGAGIHERTFLQKTPNGDLVIITLEGENPAEGFGKMVAAMPDGFAEFVLDVHGFDMKGPAPPPLPDLVYDSRA
ncbi:MAG: hypothetical protein CL398_08720 [Acidiferrobacteraceae bacterium]|nr:hypothetical protein [Acidiferrobacteraceae bacterium]